MIELRPLGSSGLSTARLVLGGNVFGNTVKGEEAFAVLDRFVAAGGTMIDTADVYSAWVPGHVGGESETLIGEWLKRRGRRDDVLIATKVGYMQGLAPERIAEGIEASLRRLQTDYVDLYQVHAPDPSVPLEETLEALDGLVRAGKVRALGASNYPAWLLAWAVALQDRHGWAPFVSLQPQYSLVERSIEVEILPFCRAAGLGVLPWGPLGAGFLTGKYSRDSEPPEGSRMAEATDDLEEARHRRAIERNFAVVDAAEAIAAERGATVSQVALAWLLGEPGVVAPIMGPRTFEQLEDLLGAADLRLSDEERERLSAPAPPPVMYPQRMLHEQTGLDELAQLRR